ncbi:MAG TPA: hypothetical protein VJY34_06940 [Roseiarcus sp.]|nr:hypothetical protein [Roseiarcus sp.]
MKLGHYASIIKAASIPEAPFGDEGPEGRLLVGALCRALAHFNLRYEAASEDDPSDPSDKKVQRAHPYFRPGVEHLFSSQDLADAVLGLAVVLEDKNDTLGHWVVLVGKKHLHGTGIDCEERWNSVVLDSDRGYERWLVTEGEDQRSAFYVRRGTTTKAIKAWCVYSFISVSAS